MHEHRRLKDVWSLDSELSSQLLECFIFLA